MIRERGYPPPGMAVPRAIAWWSLRTMTAGVRIDGLENVPPEGPVLLAARHYHHRLDGSMLIRYVPRPVHIVIGLDWIAQPARRRVMEKACSLAQWPAILRPRTTPDSGAYDTAEVSRYLRSGLREAASLLARGRVVAVFPEGYPVVDPDVVPSTPRDRDAAGMLPFDRGFRAVADLALRAGARDLRIVPVGFAYERRGRKWRITARFGAALPESADVAAVQAAVRELSRPG